MLWKPKPDATASEQEFIRARAVFVEIHAAARWNPWVEEDRAAEYEAALAVFGQWTCAEAGLLPKTREDIDAEHEQRQAD
jgi:hypothetical protein